MAEEIAYRFSTLELADIYATITYHLRHRTAVDEYLRERLPRPGRWPARTLPTWRVAE